MTRFPVSGVETQLWLPPLVAFVISYVSSMGGVSGAFLILPFQMSFLGFTSPAVSPTNLVYNIVAIPTGIWRYLREGRMVWPLAVMVLVGTLPGVVAGAFIRLIYLPDPGPFKIFVACVLTFLGTRLIIDFVRDRGVTTGQTTGTPASRGVESWRVRLIEADFRRLAFEFRGCRYHASFSGIASLSFAVGIVGGIYGVGGGAIIAPFFVAVFGLPVHAVAGASLMGTFATSLAGVGFYQAVAPYFSRPDLAVAPDWSLGALFGLGGVCGMYLGARTQRYVPARWLKLILSCLVWIVAGRYFMETLGR